MTAVNSQPPSRKSTDTPRTKAPETAVSQASSTSARNFQDRLDQAQQRGNSPRQDGQKQQNGENGLARKSNIDRSGPQNGHVKLRDKNFDDEDKLLAAGNGMKGDFAKTMAAQITSAQGTPDPATAAFLERIAAAIAEHRADGRQPQFSIEFGGSNPLANGALLSRDAAGAISIRIMGLDPRIDAIQQRMLKAQLRTGLNRRAIKVKEISLGHDKRPSAKKRDGPA